MDRPSESTWRPSPSGPDASTQVELEDVFDFDLHVDPIAHVLAERAYVCFSPSLLFRVCSLIFVSCRIEQALQEVLEEEEMKTIQAHKDEFLQDRNAQLAELQRLQAAEDVRFFASCFVCFHELC
jgi:hypothetical protein